jgi:hypothetical protein
MYVLVIDQSEYIEDRPVPGPFPDFPMTKREKPWERGCPETDYPRAFDSFPRIAGSGNEIVSMQSNHEFSVLLLCTQVNI